MINFFLKGNSTVGPSRSPPHQAVAWIPPGWGWVAWNSPECQRILEPDRVLEVSGSLSFYPRPENFSKTWTIHPIEGGPITLGDHHSRELESPQGFLISASIQCVHGCVGSLHLCSSRENGCLCTSFKIWRSRWQ